MAKNIIFIMNIKLGGSGRYSADRSLPYKYGIASWRKWAEKNNAEVFILDELITPIETMTLGWQRFYMFDLLEASGIDYDQVMYVDADSMIHPDTPNFFEMTDGKFTVCVFDGSYDWVIRSMELYSTHMFNDKFFEMSKYFGSGWYIANESHKPIFKKLTELFLNNKDLFKHLQTYHVGTDQTPFNFIVHTDVKPDITQLGYEFNMNDMARKEVLTDDLLFTKVGWVYQFNAIPDNKDNSKTLYFMKKTYEHFYGKLK